MTKEGSCYGGGSRCMGSAPRYHYASGMTHSGEASVAEPDAYGPNTQVRSGDDANFLAWIGFNIKEGSTDEGRTKFFGECIARMPCHFFGQFFTNGISILPTSIMCKFQARDTQ